MRYVDGCGMNAQRDKVEIRTKTKKERIDFTSLCRWPIKNPLNEENRSVKAGCMAVLRA